MNIIPYQPLKIPGRGRRVPELSEYGSRTGPGVHPMPSVRAERRSRADEILREGPIV